jgi:chemotaxis protein methyltransferase WspC
MQAQASGFAIANGIRRCVRFRIGNALDPMLFDPSERFDVVFCRNLLIYLHPEARARVLRTLLGALEPRGLLFAGQAEVLNATSELRPYEGGCPLSYIREAATVSGPPEASTRPNPGKVATAARAPAQPDKAAKPAAIAEPSPQVLADAGRLDEARMACGRRLQHHPEDIETARADRRAADEAFARVCFLDRNHVPAIDHRIALAERLGHPEVARDLRKRAQRLRSRLERSP